VEGFIQCILFVEGFVPLHSGVAGVPLAVAPTPGNPNPNPIPAVYTGPLNRTSGPEWQRLSRIPLYICRVSISRNEWGIDL
jgi:hypothetical protein